MQLWRCVCVGVLLCGLGVGFANGQGVTTATKTEAELDLEARQADELYRKSQVLATLPMYEELSARRPKNAGYLERLAMAYIAKSAVLENAVEGVAARNHARQLFHQAAAMGDQSELLQVMLEKMGPAETAPTSPEMGAVAVPGDPRAPGAPFPRAELLFNKGDLKGAVEFYKQSWEQNPKFYPAPLYAGDSEYKLDHYDEAGVWYQRAIDINPDMETAHRYWADCLVKAGKLDEAGRQYVEAYIGDPYQKATQLSLKGWAKENKMRWVTPAVSLPPPAAVGKDGHINITFAVPDKGKEDPLGPGALMYSMNSALWQGDKFKKEYPNEKVYRHSLAEEMDGIRGLLAVVKEQKVPEKKLSPTLKSLMDLDKDGMLECWILLDNPDNGLAQDYVAYRAKHKDLLRAYIRKYDLHPA